jgi:hypothetical protein
MLRLNVAIPPATDDPASSTATRRLPNGRACSTTFRPS